MTAASATAVMMRGPRLLRATSITIAPPAGLIAIGGPPFGGKSALAAELLDWLPRAVKLEAPDSLIPGRRQAPRSLESLVREVRRTIHEKRGAPQNLLVVSRFPTREQRRRVRAAARDLGVRFLFVEARSGERSARQRLLARTQSIVDAKQLIARYREALAGYRPVSRVEQLMLPAVRLERVQSELNEAVARVLAVWARS